MQPLNSKEDRSLGLSSQARGQKLKEIDALYRAQIKQIYQESKEKIEKKEIDPKKTILIQQKKSNQLKKQGQYNLKSMTSASRQMQSAKSASTLNVPESQSSSKMFNSGADTEEKVRASVFLKGESTRTIQILRRENQTKQLKIRELSNKCENLIEKLKKHLPAQQFEAEIQNLQEFSDNKMQRLEHLFKIKHQEIFFKIKLQVIGLLQEFAIPKQQLAEFNQVSSESNLYTLMSRKLKNKLKDFRSKEQENSFEMQRDRILNQKQEERIHFLTQTNQLLKLSEQKLKNKIEDLKFQLNQYLDKLKQREKDNQENQNELFRLKKKNEELNNVNQKLSNALHNANSEKIEEKRMYEAKQKEMKSLLNNYFVEKKKLEADLEEKQGDIEQLLIKQKFLEQENQRINRQLVRWKERFQWLEKEKEIKIKEVEDEKVSLMNQFQQYKLENNQGILMSHQAEIEEALRKVEEYQRAYERVVLELEEERRLLQRSEEQAEEKFHQFEMQWLQRVKNLEKIKDQQLDEIAMDCQSRITEMREKFQKNEQLHAQQMQARLKALLAEKDKKSTEQLIELESENEQLRRQISDLNKIIEVKESLINVINNKKALH